MSREAIEKILSDKKRAVEASAAPVGESEDRFYSIIRADGLVEEFLEFRLRNGDITCFPYSDINFFHWDSKNESIDLDFAVAMVTIKGRGLVTKLFPAIKTKRVAWIKEADSDMQDHAGNESHISEIRILPAELETEDGAGEE